MLQASYLIPAFPLAGFALLVLAGSRLKGTVAGWLATSAIGASFLVTLGAFIQLWSKPEHARSVTRTVFTWFSSGGLHVKVAFLLDPLSVTMALFVTGVGTLIHLYSIGYMQHDERFARFFTYLNLFAFSMLMLVLADNFVLTFLGWEGVGACSYLLISFWFERETAASAGKKAFVTNRVGDFGFMLGMFLLFSHLGTLQYKGVFASLGHLPHSAAVAVALLLFLGATGKSAQLPLYVWLPDAMEGPTPVSALIHAATMVTAGVFLMVRISPILHLTPGVLTVIAIVGAATALFAATIACAQDDIKKVLAYSTISQLGYMFLAVGSGAYVAAIFHMVTHAFFKALLFLGAGSVIHGLHDEQDMKRMGALRKYMPITAATFIVGWLAIAGIPPFAGFWSKDDILTAAWGKSPVLWAVGALTALLTAYYMTRQVVLVFYGEERWRHSAEADKAELTEPEPVADEPEPAAAPDPVHADAHGGHGAHGAEPHESPWTMALPLVVLAALAVVGGALNLPFTKHTALLERWLDPVVGRFAVEPHASKLLLGAAALAAAGIGLALGLNVWRKINHPELEPVILKRAWGVDALYAAIIETPGRALAAFSAFVVDKQIVDGAVNGVATLVRNGGGQLRRLQTGYVRNYALAISAGGALLLGWVLFRVAGG